MRPKAVVLDAASAANHCRPWLVAGALLIGLLMALPARSGLVTLAIEAERIDVSRLGAETATLLLKSPSACAGCDTQTYSVGPGASFSRAGRAIAFDRITEMSGQPGTVFVDNESGTVIKVSW